jgi:hypothetical protein
MSMHNVMTVIFISAGIAGLIYSGYSILLASISYRKLFAKFEVDTLIRREFVYSPYMGWKLYTPDPRLHAYLRENPAFKKELSVIDEQYAHRWKFLVVFSLIFFFCLSIARLIII